VSCGWDGGGGETGGGRVAAVKPWARQSGGVHCPNAGGVVGRLYSDRVTDLWVPHGFRFFIICPKTGLIFKIEMDVLSCSKNSQF
jgi:hypothetical protein